MFHSLNDNIKKLRIANEMNQVEFASKVGVTKQCVSNWENDNVLPSIEMLVKIADTFKVSTDYLLGIDCKKRLDVSKLTNEQAGHISLLINDFEKVNKKQP